MEHTQRCGGRRRSIPGFGPYTPTSQAPECFITSQEKKELIAAGIGKSVDHGTAFRFFNPTDYHLTEQHKSYKTSLETRARTVGQSANVNERVMIANADEKDWALEIVKAWLANHTAAVCR